MVVLASCILSPLLAHEEVSLPEYSRFATLILLIRRSRVTQHNKTNINVYLKWNNYEQLAISV